MLNSTVAPIRIQRQRLMEISFSISVKNRIKSYWVILYSPLLGNLQKALNKVIRKLVFLPKKLCEDTSQDIENGSSYHLSLARIAMKMWRHLPDLSGKQQCYPFHAKGQIEVLPFFLFLCFCQSVHRVIQAELIIYESNTSTTGSARSFMLYTSLTLVISSFCILRREPAP